ncbi:MAG TPA: NAD-dependent epimerase/dehydratase family protein [Myxococcales bacterium]|nr:NAD-dependent epimerase/dehydratase family protein [Myxococcales bacterium]
MKVILYGATGMVGQGVLRECLLAPDVSEVLAVGRGAPAQKHDKLRELVLKDLLDYSGVESQLAGYDACFWCLGVSSVGMAEADYRRITLDYTVAAARALAKQNPNMKFVFISGANTDPKGKAMWARVKGEAEIAVLEQFANGYAFRPAFIRPLHGITSRTRSYRILYAILSPLVPVLMRMFPRHTATTEQVGRAMLEAARRGAPKRILESEDIVTLARRGT